MDALKSLCIIPPSQYEEESMLKLALRMTKKKGLLRKKPLEDITQENIVWMPYHRVQFGYSPSEEGSVRGREKRGQGETALNAMLCGSAKDENELIMLFRPNYLEHKMTRRSPQSKENVGPASQINLDEVLKSLLERLHRVNGELEELRPTLSKRRVRNRRYSMILPVIGDLRQKEEKLSGRVARLRAIKNILDMCFNVDDNIASIEVTDQSTFYYPTSVVTLKHKEDGTERYLVINLVKSAGIRKHLHCDKVLTELCNRNSACKEVIARLIEPHSSHRPIDL